MKVISDVSAIIKIVVICLLVGFVLGFCSSGVSWLPPEGSADPSPAPGAPLSERPAD